MHLRGLGATIKGLDKPKIEHKWLIFSGLEGSRISFFLYVALPFS